jgi:hypothetical protein
MKMQTQYSVQCLAMCPLDCSGFHDHYPYELQRVDTYAEAVTRLNNTVGKYITQFGIIGDINRDPQFTSITRLDGVTLILSIKKVQVPM